MKKFIYLCLLLFTSSFLWAEKPIVSDIKASFTKGTKIQVSWTLPKKPDTPISKLYVYKSKEPITTYKQIKSLSPIAVLEPNINKYTDNVLDYADYFYCVITYTQKPYDLVLVSMNSTVKAAHIPLPKEEKKGVLKQKEEKQYLEGTMRETPLPYIDILSYDDEKSTISKNAVNKAKSLATSSKSEEQTLLPYFFEEDLISPDGGDEYILFEILKNTFVQEKYEEANNQLKRLTNRNINKEVLNRSYFYIGQTEYFLGNYEEAVKAFICVIGHSELTNKWINASLEKINN